MTGEHQELVTGFEGIAKDLAEAREHLTAARSIHLRMMGQIEEMWSAVHEIGETLSGAIA